MLSFQQKTAQHSVHLTGGIRRVFQAFLAAESFFRQSGESPLRPPAGNANR